MNKEYTYLTSIEITEKALDILNIKQFLVKDKELNSIMDDIRYYIEIGNEQDAQKVENYLKQYPSIFSNEPDIFNYMADDEFMEYCQKRYPEIHWGYEFIERYWVRG